MWKKRHLKIDTDRCYLRLPKAKDYIDWVNLRKGSETFLAPWEPDRDKNFYSMRLFKARLKWSSENFNKGKVIHTFIFKRKEDSLIGAITLDNLRGGVSQSCSIGYWIGEGYARNGYMSEVLSAMVFVAFKDFDISRIEAATLPENVASRRLLEKLGFKYEGVAQSYLKIAGRWRNHVLYALIRDDRRGRNLVDNR